MVLIAGLMMLVVAVGYQIGEGASFEEIFFTIVMVLFVTGMVHSSINRISIDETKKNSKRLMEEYKRRNRR
jgi:hypothetical protein